MGISGTLNYQVFNQFDPSPEAETEAIQISSSFDVDFSQGIGGLHDTERIIVQKPRLMTAPALTATWMDEEACNYSATATTDVGAEMLYLQGPSAIDGNVLDECGVMRWRHSTDLATVKATVLDECGVCGGSGIPEGQCDCEGNILGECGVCGGEGIPEGDCDCDGNVLDECGECG